MTGRHLLLAALGALMLGCKSRQDLEQEQALASLLAWDYHKQADSVRQLLEPHVMKAVADTDATTRALFAAVDSLHREEARALRERDALTAKLQAR